MAEGGSLASIILENSLGCVFHSATRIFADRPLNWPDAILGSQKMSEHTHISEERLCGLAIDPTQEVQDDEDQHLADCEQCMRLFVQFLKETESCCRELLCMIMQAALR